MRGRKINSTPVERIERSLIRTLSLPIAAIIMATILTSGKIDINLEHHINLPPELSNKSTFTVTKPSLLGLIEGKGVVTDIRMGNEVKSQNTVKDIIKVLQEAQKGDTVIFHINGNGGEVDTTLEIINNIQTSKAHTIAIVESPSYSGHAYIASSVNELHIDKYAYLMFHDSSALGTDCTKKDGKYDPASLADRGTPALLHCQMQLNAHLTNVNKFLNSILFLTQQQKFNIEHGIDVYVTSEDYANFTQGKYFFIN